MSAFEEALRDELSWLLRAGVPQRGIRIAVREQFAVRLERGPLGAREVSDAMEAAVRAACRLVRELDAPNELVDMVCRAALEASDPPMVKLAGFEIGSVFGPPTSVLGRPEERPSARSGASDRMGGTSERCRPSHPVT